MSKVAIVTGYSSGLGAKFTEDLLARGWSVVGVSRTSEPKELHASYGHSLVAVHGPAQNQPTVDAAFSTAAELGQVCLVLNCAGVGVFGEVGLYQETEIRSVIESNLSALILFSDRAAATMRTSGGHIVNVMSTAGKKLRPSESVYVAAKWGAKAYTRTLREALKAEKSPVKVIEVYPGGMRTPFWTSAVRAPSDGSSFPDPGPIAAQVTAEIESDGAVYCQEFVFERA